MPARKDTRFIVIHCSATPPKVDADVEDIASWHREKGWRDVGYNFVIRRDGVVEEGRDIEAKVSSFDETGAHAEHYNEHALGICMVGGVNAAGAPEDNFTIEQYAALAKLVTLCKAKFPAAAVLGHRDLPGVHKACPSFDVKSWWAGVKNVDFSDLDIAARGKGFKEDDVALKEPVDSGLNAASLTLVQKPAEPPVPPNPFVEGNGSPGSSDSSGSTAKA